MEVDLHGFLVLSRILTCSHHLSNCMHETEELIMGRSEVVRSFLELRCRVHFAPNVCDAKLFSALGGNLRYLRRSLQWFQRFDGTDPMMSQTDGGSIFFHHLLGVVPSTQSTILVTRTSNLRVIHTLLRINE